MARKFHERRSLRNALSTFLQGRGWSVTYKEGFKFDGEVTVPTVAVHFLPNSISELEIGRGDAKRNFVRRVQVDCYMEDENRADAITDDVMDFMDDVTITVLDTETGAELGYMYTDSATILAETVPPIFSEPKVNRWRGVIKATYETFYD